MSDMEHTWNDTELRVCGSGPAVRGHPVHEWPPGSVGNPPGTWKERQA